MRQPTARTWEILDLARRAADEHGTTTEVILALAIEAMVKASGEEMPQAVAEPPDG